MKRFFCAPDAPKSIEERSLVNAHTAAHSIFSDQINRHTRCNKKQHEDTLTISMGSVGVSLAGENAALPHLRATDRIRVSNDVGQEHFTTA